MTYIPPASVILSAAALSVAAGTASADLVEIRASGTLQSSGFLWYGETGPLHGESWELVYTIDTSLFGTGMMAAVSASLRVGAETYHADLANQGPGTYMYGSNLPSNTYNRDCLNMQLDFGDGVFAGLWLSASDTWWYHPADGFDQWQNHPDPYYGNLPASFDLSDFVDVTGRMTTGGQLNVFSDFLAWIPDRDPQTDYQFILESVTGRVVPTPGAAAFLLTAGLAATRRRR